MPPILSVVNPTGADEAVEGFGAPLASGASKAQLSEPMTRGAYVIASKDRKTILKLLVMACEEAGFEPDQFALSGAAEGLPAELLARLRGAWTIGQLTIESYDPAVYPALDFMLGFARRFALLTDGVVADPLCQRYLLPEQVFNPRAHDLPFDTRDSVVVRYVARPEGVYVHTLGLQKFGLPEIEIPGNLPGEEDEATAFLFGLTQWVLRGHPLEVGECVGSPVMPFQIAVGGLDRRRWDGVPCIDLLPPTTASPATAIAAWRNDSMKF